jgi:hypothetical protein
MTTRKELQAWLEQFPEDAKIEVIVSHEDNRSWDTYTFVSEVDLDLTESVDPEFGTYAKTFEIEREYRPKLSSGPVNLIRLGVKN